MDDRCGKVPEWASAYLICMFYSCSTVNSLSLKTNFKMIIKNLSYSPFKVYWCALLQTHPCINSFVHEKINFLQREVIQARHTVLQGPRKPFLRIYWLMLKIGPLKVSFKLIFCAISVRKPVPLLWAINITVTGQFIS